jgi:hypothetical protein
MQLEEEIEHLNILLFFCRIVFEGGDKMKDVMGVESITKAVFFEKIKWNLESEELID